jgi:DMSO reductase family type II enzyme heme b subunit
VWLSSGGLFAQAESSPKGPSAEARNAPDAIGGAAMGEKDRGAVLYQKYCAVCHGENGDGAGKFAYLMNPRPRDFRQGDFKLATTVNQVPSEADLLRTISQGMPGSAMPPWGHLPQADLKSLVQYVRQIHVDAVERRLREQVTNGIITEAEVPGMLAEYSAAGTSLTVPPEPGFDDVRWFRGRRIYLEACASCHGADGHPVPEAVKYDADGYPVPPRSFVSGIFKGGSDGHQLYARIVKGMKGTPMPAFAGTYSNDEIWDLIHYVQSLARAGAQDRAQLRQGTFTAARVEGSLPTGPLDVMWEHAQPLYVGLTPLWWIEERIEGLVVQALHNQLDLVIRLSWIDPTVDDRAVRQDEFRDAIALQFSLTSDPPFYMGDPGEHGGVNIWMWKADRQQDITEGHRDVDHAFPDRVVDQYPEQHLAIADIPTGEWPRSLIVQHDPQFITAWGAGNLVATPDMNTPVECLVARGPGTLSGRPGQFQLVQGQAAYERGVWYVQLQRAMQPPHEHSDAAERPFKPGDYVPVSFAIWNGAVGDRDGKKNISIWQKLLIE